MEDVMDITYLLRLKENIFIGPKIPHIFKNRKKKAYKLTIKLSLPKKEYSM